MFLELHLLQNFALSNLNRDDTGAPKSCIFAGGKRARISSQCLKRAVRTVVREEGLIPSENLAYRTKKVVPLLTKRLTEIGLEAELSQLISLNAIEGMSYKLKNGKTEYLLMVGEREIYRLAELCANNVEKLNMPRKDNKKNSEKPKLDSKLLKQLLTVFDGGDAVDLALFGRMVATHPQTSVDAAVQMAHAFSTNVVTNEFDFFSAVDDLQDTAEDSGAGAAMLGTMLYNSSCYYRYANLDMHQLSKNLGEDQELAFQAAIAFFDGMIKAIPTGKQTNSGAQNPPSLIIAVVRDSGLWSLANAFTTSVTGFGEDMVGLSAKKIIDYWGQLTGLYGTEGISYAGYATYLTVDQGTSQLSAEPSVSNLKQKVTEALCLDS